MLSSERLSPVYPFMATSVFSAQGSAVTCSQRDTYFSIKYTFGYSVIKCH